MFINLELSVFPYQDASCVHSVHLLSNGRCAAHGIQVDDVDKDETDGHDEVIVTLDSENSILDDYLYSHFVCAMKAGVHLTILCDTCNR